MRLREEGYFRASPGREEPTSEWGFSLVFSFWHPSNMTAIKSPEKWMETIWKRSLLDLLSLALQAIFSAAN